MRDKNLGQNDFLNISLSKFFVRIYSTFILGVVVSFFSMFFIKKYAVSFLLKYNLEVFMYITYIFAFLSVLLFQFYLSNFISLVDINKKKAYIFYFLYTIFYGVIFYPIFNYTDYNIIKLAFMFSIFIFILCSIIGIFISYNLSNLSKILLFMVWILFIIELINMTSFIALTSGQILSMCFFILGFYCVILASSIQDLKDLYYRTEISHEGLILIGSFILFSQFFAILIRIIKILEILNRREK